MSTRKSFDEDAYVERIQNGPCFICEMIAGRLQGNRSNDHTYYQSCQYVEDTFHALFLRASQCGCDSQANIDQTREIMASLLKILVSL